jgi:hypothetical protein
MNKWMSKEMNEQRNEWAKKWMSKEMNTWING